MQPLTQASGLQQHASDCCRAPLAPRVNYVQLLRRHGAGCPALFFAPMENLADRPARMALKETIGGFDEACTEFIRVPRNSDSPAATTRGITAWYDAWELGDVPLAAQLMGSNTDLLVAAAERLVHAKQAPRVDLNCGCPANTVTGGGAGSSLLKDPEQLHRVVAGLVDAIGGHVPVSVKMRSGFDDTALYQDNLMAVQEAGASFVTIHPRTKRQAYTGRADWSLIRLAKQLLRIPVVGNGDIVCVSSALAMLQETGCDGLMIGRGAVQDPLLFLRIRRHFAAQRSQAQRNTNCNQFQLHTSNTESTAHLQQQQQQHCQVQPGCQLPGLASYQRHGPSHVLHKHRDTSQPFGNEAAAIELFLRCYASYGFDGRVNGAAGSSQSGRIGRLKKVMKYIFSGEPQLRQACAQLLQKQPGDVTADGLLEAIVEQVWLHWKNGGPPQQILVSHFTTPGRQVSRYFGEAGLTWQAADSKQGFAAV